MALEQLVELLRGAFGTIRWRRGQTLQAVRLTARGGTRAHGHLAAEELALGRLAGLARGECVLDGGGGLEGLGLVCGLGALVGELLGVEGGLRGLERGVLEGAGTRTGLLGDARQAVRLFLERAELAAA